MVLPLRTIRGAIVWVGLAQATIRGRECDATSYTTVNTTNGPITGHAAPNSPCVLEYLGIPYAQPPVGQLRFAPPQRLIPVDGTGPGVVEPYEAAQFGPDCPLTPGKRVDYPDMTSQAQRIIGYFASAAGTPQGEDCLRLNIWSRATERSDEGSKPVLVFFHGGRFVIGNTNTPFYTGKYLADAEDMVVVTVTYRLNIFGFPGSSSLSHQNLGLRDQRLAVEWVRDNIRGFGGDPAKIVIAGQSAGGVAVDYWTFAYDGSSNEGKDPIVSGIIAASGTALSFPVNAPGVPERNWNAVVEAVGCGTENATTDEDGVLSCMCAARWEDIKTAAAMVSPTQSSNVLRSIPAFYPQPDGELVLEASEYVRRGKSGQFATVPMLVGSTDNEDGYYRIPAYGNGVVAPTAAQVRSFLLESFTCPVSFAATSRNTLGRRSSAAWAYRYLADWDNTRLFLHRNSTNSTYDNKKSSVRKEGISSSSSGAYHGVDLHMVFGASEDVSGLPATAEQKALTRLVQRAWFAFADDPARGLSERLGWPEFDPGTDSLVLLGQENKAEARFVRPAAYDGPCSTVTLGAFGSVVPTTVPA